MIEWILVYTLITVDAEKAQLNYSVYEREIVAPYPEISEFGECEMQRAMLEVELPENSDFVATCKPKEVLQ